MSAEATQESAGKQQKHSPNPANARLWVAMARHRAVT